LSHTNWNVLPPVEQTASIADVPPLIVQLLHNRGISSPEDIELFLSNDASTEFDPFLLPDIHQAVRRIYQALFSGEKIVIYGDFDADGITATALLVQGLTALGGDVIPYIPSRSSEGYGLRASALEKLHQEGVGLVVTVDNGITAFEEVKRASKLGMDVVITDHHEPLGSLPSACAVVDPKRSDSKYPQRDIAGVGVAFKLLQALVTDKSREDIVKKSLDLVAMGTVTDMVPLVKENRYWVKCGLEIINKTERPGLQELLRSARLQQGNIDSQSISWVIGPRLNAAGRIDNATTSYQLLITEDRKEASWLAEELERKNAERLKQTGELFEKVNEKVAADGTEKPLLMAGDSDFLSGIMGLVAGRIADRYYRPVILFRIGKETCRGSGRSIREFNLIEALEECQDLLTHFGGHTMAAGFSVPSRNLVEFQNRIFNFARTKLDGLDLKPHIDIDAEVPLSILSGNTFETIQSMEPFGVGNPLPTFLSRRARVIERRMIGNNGDHLMLKLAQNGITWDAVGFSLGSYFEEITPHLDIVYNVQQDTWNGHERLRLSLLDFAPSR
jgi:single-stranded-DNA-specific exonuclease